MELLKDFLEEITGAFLTKGFWRILRKEIVSYWGIYFWSSYGEFSTNSLQGYSWVFLLEIFQELSLGISPGVLPGNSSKSLLCGFLQKFYFLKIPPSVTSEDSSRCSWRNLHKIPQDFPQTFIQGRILLGNCLAW